MNIDRHYRATSLRAAVDACIEFARTKHNKSVEQLADLCGINSKYTLYKYVADASLPLRHVLALEAAAGCTFITDYLAASHHRLVVPMPSGRNTTAKSVADLMAAQSAAAQALIEFVERRADAPAVLEVVTRAMEALAYHRVDVQRACQPDLPLTTGDQP